MFIYHKESQEKNYIIEKNVGGNSAEIWYNNSVKETVMIGGCPWKNILPG